MILDGLPHPLFPFPRHEQLPQLSPLPSDQVQTGMELSPGAVATGFAAADIPQMEGAAQKASVVNDLRQAGAVSAFPIGELRALHGVSQHLYTIVYKNKLVVKNHNENANLLSGNPRRVILSGSGIYLKNNHACGIAALHFYQA